MGTEVQKKTSNSQEEQALSEGGALGARAPALFQNYSKVPLSDK